MKSPHLIFFLLILSFQVSAQEVEEKVNDGDIIYSGLAYGFNVPGGDLNSRYGTNLQFGLFSQHITRSNFFYGADFTFLFGNVVKEDVLAGFRTPDGYFLGSSGLGADVYLRQRGLTLTMMAGKIFPLEKNSRSGIKVGIGAGILQHNIRFLDDNNAIAQIGGDLRKGYDRLTRGFTLRQQLGYQILSRNRRLNFELSFIFFQGFTNEVRDFHFDTGSVSDKSRIDLGFGFQAAWILPFYVNSSETIYY